MTGLAPVTIDNLPKKVNNDFALRISEHERTAPIGSSNQTVTLATQPTKPSLKELNGGDLNAAPPFASFPEFKGSPGAVFRRSLVPQNIEHSQEVLETYICHLTSMSEGLKRQYRTIQKYFSEGNFLSRIITDVESFCSQYQKG